MSLAGLTVLYWSLLYSLTVVYWTLLYSLTVICFFWLLAGLHNFETLNVCSAYQSLIATCQVRFCYWFYSWSFLEKISREIFQYLTAHLLIQALDLTKMIFQMYLMVIFNKLKPPTYLYKTISCVFGQHISSNLFSWNICVFLKMMMYIVKYQEKVPCT